MKNQTLIWTIVAIVIVLVIIGGIIYSADSPGQTYATSGDQSGTPSGTAGSPTPAGSIPASAPMKPAYSYAPSSAVAKDIQVVSPIPGATLSGGEPIKISGTALGSWFSQTAFPVVLISSEGKVISTGNASAQEDWMKVSPVHFLGSLTFVKQTPGSRGILILKKDNPSGLPQNDESVTIPVVFN